jgi:Icc protein
MSGADALTNRKTMTESRVTRLLHITDPHLYADERGEIYGVVTERSFRAVLQQAIATAPGRIDGILATGDLVDDCSEAGYRRFLARMENLGVPALCLPGNHDDPALMADILNVGLVQFCGEATFGKWQIVLLDSHEPGKDSGRVSAEECARLDQQLSQSNAPHALVCVHHQVLPMGSPWLDSVGLVNADEIMSILSRHEKVRGVVWGHVHQASDRTRKSMRLLSTPSTCAQFTPNTDACIMDVRPPGYRWIELHANGTIDTQVSWLDNWQLEDRPPDSRSATGGS